MYTGVFDDSRFLFSKTGLLLTLLECEVFSELKFELGTLGNGIILWVVKRISTGIPLQ